MGNKLRVSSGYSDISIIQVKLRKEEYLCRSSYHLYKKNKNGSSSEKSNGTVLSSGNVSEKKKEYVQRYSSFFTEMIEILLYHLFFYPGPPGIH